MAAVAAELQGAKERAETHLLTLAGVTGVDIGYKEVGGEPTDRLAIRVLVAEKKPKSRLRADQRVPEEIDGHPTDVIERHFELHQLGASVPLESLAPPVDTRVYDPLRGGVSIGPCRVVNGFVHAGTLGAIVVDNTSNEYLALSSFHVICVDDGSSPGDTIAQPSRVDGGSCPGDVIGTLRRHALTTSVDAAVAAVGADGVVSRSVTCEVVEIGAVTGTSTAPLGAAVRKRGRTTGLTFGIVDSVSLTLILDYGDGIGRRTLTNQIGVKPDAAQNPTFTAKGDTGSVLVNDAREVVGLLVAGDDAGYGVANPIAEVLGALNVSLCTPTVGKLRKVEGKPENKPENKEGKEEKLEGIDKKPEALEGTGGPRRVAVSATAKGVSERVAAAPKQAEFKWRNKLENKELKDAKGGEKSENKENKFEAKEDKDFKDHKDEVKELKDERKENKENKDYKDDKGENKEAKNEKAEKDLKNEKIEKDERKESKDYKDGKGENKEGKDEKAEKTERKELKNEKIETKPEKDEKEGKSENKDLKEDKDGKDQKDSKDQKDFQAEVPLLRSRLGATAGPATVEERIAALEATVGRLSHFIEGSLRPDLSHGALAGEPDVAAERRPPEEGQSGQSG